jgi:hypothetical protein
MISLNDCIAMCGLTNDEVAAIAEQEQLPQISTSALADYLLSHEGGSLKARNTIRDDIRAALARGDEARAHELVMRLAQLVRANA